MDSIKPFDWQGNMNEVATGFKNNPFLKDPNVAPPVNVGMGYPVEVEQKMHSQIPSPGTPDDPWNVARQK